MESQFSDHSISICSTGVWWFTDTERACKPAGDNEMVSFAALVIWEGNIYTFAEALVKKVYSQTMLHTWEEWNPKTRKTHMFLFQKFSNKKAPVRALSTYYRKEKKRKRIINENENGMTEKNNLERYDTKTADERGGGGRALRGKLNVCVRTFASLRRSFQGLLIRWIQTLHGVLSFLHALQNL